MEYVVLVDTNDKEIGIEEKIKAHIEGKLHRALSVLIFNSGGKMLIQKRSASKYHSHGLWSNSVCGHPHYNETIEKAAHRRLKEEMGFDCKLTESFNFIYEANLGDLIEYEFDHVFLGKYDGEINPNPDEVQDYKWVDKEDLKRDLKNNSQKYTAWFIKLIREVKD